MGLLAELKGIVSRMLPQALDDGDEGDVRLARYGEMCTVGIVRKQHGLVDEGSYFVTSNGNQTGILSSGATGFVATTPALIIANTDSPANQNNKRVHIDFLNLVTTVVGSAASGLVNLQAALYIDNGNRYSSGGTEIS